MLTTLEVRDIYEKIQKQLFYMIPEKWDRVYLYASVLDHYNSIQTGEMFFYYYPKSILKKNPVNVYEIPNKFNIDEQIYLKYTEKLYEAIKELHSYMFKNGEEPWSSLTISIQNFKFNVEYNYDNLISSGYTSYERHIIWRYKYLDAPLTSYSKKDRELLERYLIEGEDKNPNITTYSEGLYRKPVGNIIEYNKEEKPLRQATKLNPKENVKSKVKERLEIKQKEKMDAKIKERVEARLKSIKIKENIEVKPEENINTKVKQKIEVKPKEKANTKVKEEIEIKPQEKANTKVKEKKEIKPQEKANTKVKEKKEIKPKEKANTKVKEKIEVKPKEKINTKVKEKIEDKPKEKVDTKIKVKPKETVSSKLKETVEVKPKENIISKFKKAMNTKNKKSNDMKIKEKISIKLRKEKIEDYEEIEIKNQILKC